MAGLDRINGLDEGNGVIYESETNKRPEYKTLEQTKEEVAREEAAAAKVNLHSRFDGPGVAVELSTESVKASEEYQREAARSSENSILDILVDAWRQIRKFFSDLWNGGSDNILEASEIVDTSNDSEEITINTRIASTENLNNSPENIASFMMDYGGKKLAKNSDLLTQYDRSGKIISPSPSDRRRILQGEGQVRHYK